MANGLRLAVAWARSVAGYAFLCLYVAIVGPPAFLVTTISGRTRHLFVLVRFVAKTARQILGIGFVVDGMHWVDDSRPTVYVINHRSNVDVLIFEILLPACPRLRAIYKAEMNQLPILGRAMRAAGFVPVERADRERAIEAVDTAVARLVEGYSFLLAPEGTRNTADEMRPFKKGAFVMAIKAQAAIVPIALIGTAEAMPRGRAYITPTRVTVRVGPPIPAAGLTMDDRDALAGRVRGAMEALLAQGAIQ